jgi:peptidoglycan/LPS O-acetylase OafA/YrhL
VGGCFVAQRPAPPENAETTSGDLIEVCRDSIRPLRGRWQADLWYLRQAAGCMLRAKTPMNLRNWLLTGLTLAFLILVFSALMYPDPSPGPDPLNIRFLGGIIAAFLFYAYAAIWRTCAATPEDELVLRLGTKWGVAIGFAWIGAYVSWGHHFWWSFILLFPAVFVCSLIGGVSTCISSTASAAHSFICL